MEEEPLMPERFGLIADPKRVREIERFYDRAAIMIRNELMKLDVGNFSEIEIEKVQNKVNAIIKNMNKYVVRWSRDSVTEAYKNGMTTTRISLNILGAKRDPFFDQKTHRRTVDADEITTDDVYFRANESIKVNVGIYFYLLRKSHDDLMQIQAFDLRDEEVIAGLLDDAIREGASRGKLEQLIRQHFRRELYEKKFININGRNYNLTKYAKMVARTRLRTVQSDAVKNVCAQYDNDLVHISDHGTTTPICIPYEGNDYSISGKTPGFETLDRWPPFHPNCQHYASPTSVEAIEVKGTRRVKRER